MLALLAGVVTGAMVLGVYMLLCAKIMAAYLHDRIEALAAQNPLEAGEIRTLHSSTPQS